VLAAPVRNRSLRAGVIASAGASVLFGVLFLLPPLLRPMDAFEVFGWRVVVTVPLLALLVALVGGWADALRSVRRMRRRPILLAVALLNALLLGVQLWLFGWAPATGHGLEVSIGYLLLPLAMVLLGRVLHDERLSRLRLAAVVSAAVGVAAALALGGAVGLPTLLVALGYPLYFDLRRRFALDGPGSALLELTLLLPIAVVLLTVRAADGTAAITPALAPGVLLLGAVSAVALWLYLTASSVLPFGLFGLLTYLEPVLLVLGAVLFLGEAVGAADALVYGPIVVALVLLALEQRPRRRPPALPPTLVPASGAGPRDGA